MGEWGAFSDRGDELPPSGRQDAPGSPLGAPGGLWGRRRTVLDLRSPPGASEEPRRVIIRRPAADVRAATAAALQRGAVIIAPRLYPDRAGTRVEWDIAGRCQRPIEVVQEGEGHLQPSASRKELEWQPNRTLAMQVPCRQCTACLRNRQKTWANRAKREFKQADSRGLRTWFGTLTFSPETRFKNLTRTRSRLDAAGENLEALEPKVRFREQHRETGALVSKFIRSLRKGRKKLRAERMFFRYLLTVEPHKDWVPHYHIMIHEVSDLYPIRKQALHDRWSHGFSSWKLVTDDNAAAYAAKYLGKFSIARVRASKNYGVIDDDRTV